MNRHATRRSTPRTTWVGVVPDWYRINHHLLDAFAIPEAENGGDLGVLLVGSLSPFRRDEANMRRHHASELWPGLGKLRQRLMESPVEQAVMPEAPMEFFRAIGGRFAIGPCPGPALCSLRGPSTFRSLLTSCLGSRSAGDYRRVTRDPQRGSGAWRRRARPDARGDRPFRWRKRRGMDSRHFVLQAAGATTCDHPHGAGGDCWSASSGSESSLRLLWTFPDACSADAPGVKTVVTGMPLRFNLPPRTAQARRVLVMSSYTHRDAIVNEGIVRKRRRFPLQIFQTEILDVIRCLREMGHHDLEFRWRPHPADTDSEIQRDLSALPNVELSRGRALVEDASWADLIVSSNSTVVVETMFAGVPVFVQLLAELQGLPATSFLAPDRIFFHSREGARLIARWLEQHHPSPVTG